MSTPEKPESSTDSPEASTDEAPQSRADIEADIEATRAQLGETVDALSAKLDVKTRAKDQAAQTVAQVKERPLVPAGVAVGVLALVVGLVVLRRRRA